MFSGPHVVGARYSVFGGNESHPVRVFSVKSSPHDPTVHVGARDFIHVRILVTWLESFNFIHLGLV